MAESSKKNGIKDMVVSLLWAVLLALLFRSVAFEPFNIPSGSMKPSLLEGDYIFVSKYSYGYSRYSFPFAAIPFSSRIFNSSPKRGDIIVFRLPTQTNINYIKRLIGLPGDRIQVKSGIVYVNGEAIKRERIEDFVQYDQQGNAFNIPQYIETLPDKRSYRVLDRTLYGSLDDTKVFHVPDKHYFFMGDNRDYSQDSRVLDKVGYVPEENLLGPARMVFFSSKGSFFKIWQWITGFRTERFFLSIGEQD